MYPKLLFLAFTALAHGKAAHVRNNGEAAVRRVVEDAALKIAAEDAGRKLTDEELAIRGAIKDEGYEISPRGITVIVRENCRWSKMMLKYLDDRDVKYNLIVARDMDSMTGILQTMRHFQRKFPAVYVDDAYVGGYEKALGDDEFNEWVKNKGIEGGMAKDSVV